MDISNRYCVIMCGGVGSRFWPYSRANAPKQFIDFFGTGRTLLQMSFDRTKDVVPTENVIILTNEQYAPLVKEQLPELKDAQILLEPTRRNTAPCIAWAAYHIKALNPDALIMVAPSDHLVLKEDEFKRCINKGFDFVAENDALLTLGIKPSRPETGYGYIQIGNAVTDSISKVKTFTEKPNVELAKVFLSTGEFFWNSGMFLWSVDSILKAVQECAPDIAVQFDKGVGLYGTSAEMQFIKQNFASCPGISIDFAVMEKSKNVYVECVDFGWDDLGTWGALYDNSPKNHEGNVTENCKAMLFNCNDCVVAAKGDKLIVASHLKDYIIAVADDVVLIVPKSEEQKIKNYVNEVKTAYGDKYL
ncbi:MAG: mannose-1-phosphate guanylyltransferase [Bacteroidales bacterium]|nr:mannose-1-phosphate guanylyltransferase [Bacteroidales bacterium]